MASFQESVKALKEAGLAHLEIFEIMSDSVDGPMNGTLSIPKAISNINKFGHEIPKEDVNINVETPSVRKRKVATFSSEKHPRKSLRQGSPGLRCERENVPFDLSFNRTVSPPSISSNRFCFSANMEENSSWLKNLLTGNSLISQKDLLRWLQKVLSFIPLAPLKYYLKQPLTTL